MRALANYILGCFLFQRIEPHRFSKESDDQQAFVNELNFKDES